MAEITDPDLLKQLSAGPAASSGLVTDPELLKQLNAEPEKSVAADVAKSGGVGLAKGVIAGAGAAGDVRNLASAATDYLGKKFGASPEAVQSIKDTASGVARHLPGGLGGVGSLLVNAPSSSDIQKGVESVTGDFYKPQTTPGKYAETTGEFLGNPTTYLGPGGALAKAGTAVGAGLGSEFGKEFTETSTKPWVKALGPLVGAIAGGTGVTAIPMALTPNIIDAGRRAMNDTLRREGVTALTAGQEVGNKGMKWAETTLADVPFTGTSAEAINETAANQYTRAALRRIGVNADRATSDVVDGAFTRIGNQFNAVGARNNVIPDAQLTIDLSNARHEYHNLVGPNNRAPVVDNTISDIFDQMNRSGGVLTGAQYNAMTSLLARQARKSVNEPQLHDALHDMREALDDAFERTLQRGTQRTITTTNPVTGAVGHTVIQGPPNPDLELLRTARRQYRNLKVIERAATSGGAEKVGQGIITPAALLNATMSKAGRKAIATGQGDFTELAKAGTGVLMPLPQSGTAARENILHYLQLASLFGGGEAGGFTGAAAAAAAGIGVPALAGRALMSRPVQGYLAGRYPWQGQYRAGTSPSTIALLNQIRQQPRLDVYPSVAGQQPGGDRPPVPMARKAPDGKWYLPDPNRPGKHVEVRP